MPTPTPHSHFTSHSHSHFIPKQFQSKTQFITHHQQNRTKKSHHHYLQPSPKLHLSSNPHPYTNPSATHLSSPGVCIEDRPPPTKTIKTPQHKYKIHMSPARHNPLPNISQSVNKNPESQCNKKQNSPPSKSSKTTPRSTQPTSSIHPSHSSLHVVVLLCPPSSSSPSQALRPITNHDHPPRSSLPKNVKKTGKNSNKQCNYHDAHTRHNAQR